MVTYSTLDHLKMDAVQNICETNTLGNNKAIDGFLLHPNLSWWP